MAEPERWSATSRRLFGGVDRAEAERTLHAGRRAFWTILAVFCLSLVVFVATILGGDGGRTVVASGLVTLGLLVAWTWLARGLTQLERSLDELDDGRARQEGPSTRNS